MNRRNADWYKYLTTSMAIKYTKKTSVLVIWERKQMDMGIFHSCVFVKDNDSEYHKKYTFVGYVASLHHK